MTAETYPRAVPATRSEGGTSLSSRKGVAILILLCLVQFMDVLDASILNIALPSIKRDLGFTQESLQWVVNGYILTYGGDRKSTRLNPVTDQSRMPSSA